MNQFEEGLKIFEEKCGNDKDNVISLATISLDKSIDGTPMPSVRDVDAYYEDGVFYVVTYGKSNKMLEIASNNQIAFSVNFENISGNAIGENLGWVLDPKNAELRTKLRKVFANWYDEANNENDVNFCYLAIRITNAVVVTGHGPTTKKYFMDFVNRTELDEVKELKERETYYFTFKGQEAIIKGREYIFEWLKENNIDLSKQKEPFYIFGRYDITKEKNSDFEYTLCIITPKRIKLVKKPEKAMMFGGDYARRYTEYGELEKTKIDFYDSIDKTKKYNIDPIITEQYLLGENKLDLNTQVLMLIKVLKKD